MILSYQIILSDKLDENELSNHHTLIKIIPLKIYFDLQHIYA